MSRNLFGNIVLDTLEVVGVVTNGDGDYALTLGVVTNGDCDNALNGDGDNALNGDGDNNGDGVDLKGGRALDPILLTLKNEKLVIDWCP